MRWARALSVASLPLVLYGCVAQPVSLAEIKSHKAFANSPLLRQGRLSVVPLSEEQYSFLVKT